MRAGEGAEAQDSAMLELDSLYEELPGRKTAVALFEAVRNRGLSHSRAACRMYVSNRARPSDDGGLSGTELRSFVQDRIGGRDVLWPAAQEVGLICTQVGLLAAIREVDEEHVDFAMLDSLLSGVVLWRRVMQTPLP